MTQSGDNDGQGGKSIYGKHFDDEKVWFPHSHKGLLSMINQGPNTNGSQFFITFGPANHLNEEHTVFGRVIQNYGLLEQIEKLETDKDDAPKQKVTIVDCGELLGGDKLKAGAADFLDHYKEPQKQHWQAAGAKKRADDVKYYSSNQKRKFSSNIVKKDDLKKPIHKVTERADLQKVLDQYGYDFDL